MPSHPALYTVFHKNYSHPVSHSVAFILYAIDFLNSTTPHQQQYNQIRNNKQQRILLIHQKQYITIIVTNEHDPCH